MEITLLEDPGCSWCWAFQPVITTLQFEVLGASGARAVKLRRVMGGLQDRPAGEPSFFARNWQVAAEISGMPFNPAIWDHHGLRTTFEACRMVKAALIQGEEAANRILRRIREAFHLKEVPIDDREVLLFLAREEGLQVEPLKENLENGRAEALFERDRREALEHRFGFPTLLFRKHPNDPPAILRGVVHYAEVLETLQTLGLGPRGRRRFTGREEDWDRLFSIHPRLTLAEIAAVTRLEGEALGQELARNGVSALGPLYSREKPEVSCLVSAPEGSD